MKKNLAPLLKNFTLTDKRSPLTDKRIFFRQFIQKPYRVLTWGRTAPRLQRKQTFLRKLQKKIQKFENL